MANKFLDKTGLSTLWTKIKSLLNNKADKVNGVYYIQGNTSGTAGKWTGTSDKIDAYYDGLLINYKIGIAGGESTTTLNINGLGAKPCYLRGTANITTHYAVGTMVILSYNASNGAFYSADYDANTNTYQRLYPSTTNKEYPITARYNTTTGSSYYAEYGRYSTGVTLNPSTNTITATTFKGNATSATKATQDGDGNVIKNTYLKKSGGVMSSDLNMDDHDIKNVSSLGVDGTITTATKLLVHDENADIIPNSGSNYNASHYYASGIKFTTAQEQSVYNLYYPKETGTFVVKDEYNYIYDVGQINSPQFNYRIMFGNVAEEMVLVSPEACLGLSSSDMIGSDCEHFLHFPDTGSTGDNSWNAYTWRLPEKSGTIALLEDLQGIGGGSSGGLKLVESGVTSSTGGLTLRKALEDNKVYVIQVPESDMMRQTYIATTINGQFCASLRQNGAWGGPVYLHYDASTKKLYVRDASSSDEVGFETSSAYQIYELTSGGSSSSNTSASGTVEKINFEITDDDDYVSIDISKYSYCEIELIHSTGTEGTDELGFYIGPNDEFLKEGLYPDDSQGRQWIHNIIIDTTGFVRMTYYDSHNNLQVISQTLDPSILTSVSFYWCNNDGAPSCTLYYVLKGVVK